MKFAYLLILAAVRAEEEEGEEKIEGTCASPEECPPVADEESGEEIEMACATMANEGQAISQDLCVKAVLCGETIDVEGNPVSYTCMGGEEESSSYLKACVYGALAYAIY